MKKTIALCATAFLATTIAAHAEFTVGDIVGTTEEAIISALEAKGHMVEEVELEDMEFEVELSMNGEEIELLIDSETGKIVEIESDEYAEMEEKDG